MAKHVITEDTIITIGKSISLSAYFAFIEEATGKKLFPDIQAWLNFYEGRPLKEALATFDDSAKTKTLEEKLMEERFGHISEPDKAFILAFNKIFEDLGYDYGGSILGDIVYGKTGIKSRPCPARIGIEDDNGEIKLRFYLKNIDKHSRFIENAPPHIKDAFVFDWGNCSKCMATCKSMKIYTIEGRQFDKCCHNIAFFHNPTIEKLPDYMALYSEFNPAKKRNL
jgi:hypothetical protein